MCSQFWCKACSTGRMQRKPWHDWDITKFTHKGYVVSFFGTSYSHCRLLNTTLCQVSKLYNFLMQLRMQPLSIKNFMQEGESLPEIFVAHHIPLAGMDFGGGGSLICLRQCTITLWAVLNFSYFRHWHLMCHGNSICEVYYWARDKCGHTKIAI